ncbi:MAG: VanZ family protein [Myxococcota bacterium]
MLERLPRESEARSWFWAGAVFLAILASIPLARAIQKAVEHGLGRGAFLWTVGIAGALGVLAAAAWRARRPSGPWHWLALGVATGLFAWRVGSLRHSPEEALHFVEYGVLSILLYRALLHRVRDPAIYGCALVLGTTLGIVDEALQWIVPGRIWDLRDLGVDVSAVALPQLAIALGLDPPLVARRVTVRGRLLLLRLSLVAVLLLGASLLNTPARIRAYSSALPGLDFLASRGSVMIEYGHRIEDPGLGVFHSRFDRAELARNDAARGDEVGALLARYPSPRDYPAFLERYTPITDPFAHEARVHLFRRSAYLRTAQEHPFDLDWYRSDLTVAYREQLFLERYFPRSLAASGLGFVPELVEYLRERQLPEVAYESRVSEGVVSAASERQVAVIWLSLLGLLAGLERVTARRLRA